MRRQIAMGLVTAALVGGISGTALAGTDDALARIDAGPIRGAVTGEVRTFTGIPYAAPPVGELRWRAPQPVAAWREPRRTIRPGPLCAQRGTHLGEGSLAEDCLYLNVTAPKGPAAGRRPVLVWLHGGSFADGGGHLYPAHRLAARGDLVVVTVNYRLGALGFLARPGLDGNAGLADQQAALRWVRRNAAAFGGDPGNVTLAGESAGGISVCAHLAAPSSAGLFHRAIIQSAPCVGSETGNDPRRRAEAEAQGREFVAALGLGPAPTTDRLRAVEPERLLAAAATAGSEFGPVVGGGLLPVEPERAVVAGRFHRVPVLHGINRDEQRLQVWGYETQRYGGPIPAGRYPAEVEQWFGDAAPRVLRQYPLHRYASASHALAAAQTDAWLAAPTVGTAAALGRSAPVFTYEFADENAPWFRRFAKPYPMGAYHAAELPYLFETGTTEPLTTAQQRLADRMIGSWAAFARDGDPGWRRSSVQGLAPGPGGIGPVDFAGRHRYRFWSEPSRR